MIVKIGLRWDLMVSDDVIGIWWFYIGSLNKIIANMPINKYLLGYCNAVEKYIW